MKIIYGWISTIGERLFVYENKQGWGVTHNMKEAIVFRTINGCNEHFLSKHRFPENYIHCTVNGYLKYYTNDGQQLLNLTTLITNN